jgi:hypothetical protein
MPVRATKTRQNEKPEAGKTLVFMKLFRLALHYCDAVWPD